MEIIERTITEEIDGLRLYRALTKCVLPYSRT